MTDLLPVSNRTRSPEVSPSDVREVLARSILADGLDLVLDINRSQGSYLVDARTGRGFLDMFTFFASSALGMNHPSLADDDVFRAELAAAALNKPSNSDVYSVPMARFVDTFARVLGDPALPHLFFVDGGALAVENALKVAFDWKSRLNEARGLDPALGTRVLHLRGAFHGRSGYTMSLTNTDPNKVARFPKFDWPRIDAPFIRPGADMDALEAEALSQARSAFEAAPHDIACFIAEPIQGEGGDRHFRPQFFVAMRDLCDEYDALLIFDEVQTGCGITGTAWAYQQLGVMPDVVAFGKKTQVCGVMAGRRVDEVQDNVFTVSSRINSTWGGNLVDMVRSRRILEVIEADGLFTRAAASGRYLLDRLDELTVEFPDLVRDVRGRGLMCAFSMPTAEQRDALVARLWDSGVIMLGCGPDSVRFRPALTVSRDEIDAAVDAVHATLRTMWAQQAQ
ncbi:L-lysine 6-transaminase [Mycolicibacterium hippocampi]|uniref:L-lysine-epsilon aminotransferase n=1 Tax=Mycolicibacterium hippocampi TaxID=659824 RepID=A0A850PYR4_9MYCO|nr:L-lysine 6-transaminase [Mycolicibacterium hippocampi]NVN52825.1 putative L-lysine-epsilon aminotransferase (L-lysine aminotransferase) (Lysine 6-aminotransferase) [Mycolicibacterium hippocampi]